MHLIGQHSAYWMTLHCRVAKVNFFPTMQFYGGGLHWPPASRNGLIQMKYGTAIESCCLNALM